MFNYPSHEDTTSDVCFNDPAAAVAGSGECDTWCTLDRAVAAPGGCTMAVSGTGAGKYFTISDACYLAAGGSVAGGVPGTTSSCANQADCQKTVTIQRGDTTIYSGVVFIWHTNLNEPADNTRSLGRQHTCASEAHPACEGSAGQWQDGDVMNFGSTGCGDNLNKLCTTQFSVISETTTSCESPVVKIDIPNWHPNNGALNAAGGWGSAGGLTFQGDGCEAVVAAPGTVGVTPRVHTDFEGQNTCAGEPTCAGPGGSTNGDGRDLLLVETDGTHIASITHWTLTLRQMSDNSAFPEGATTPTCSVFFTPCTAQGDHATCTQQCAPCPGCAQNWDLGYGK